MKDAYYFPHDSNAKDDPKCILLIEQLGLEGYGIYWVLVETLRDQPNYCYPIQLLPALARRFNTTLEKIKIVVFNYGLFEIENDTFFFSKSLIKRMSIYEEKKLKRSLAGKKGNEVRWQTDRIAIANGSQVKESKIKESKVNIIKEESPLFENSENLILETKKEKKAKSCAKKVIPEITPEIADLLSICTAKFNEKYVNDKTIAMFTKLLKSYSNEQIKQAIENGTKDDFWRMNFLSPSKLADKDKNGVYYIDKFINLKPNGANWSNNKAKQPEHLHNGGKFTTAVTKENF